MYSLVSAPVLGFDLVRAEHGARVAGLLLKAMALTEDDLPSLVGGFVLSRALSAPPVVPDPDLRDALRQGRDLMAQGRADDALRLLERSSLLGRDGMRHAVRHDVLGWVAELAGPTRRLGEQAVELVSAAVSSAMEGRGDAAIDRLDGLLLAHEGEPLDLLGPCAGQVLDLLDRLSELDPTRAVRVRRAADLARRAHWAPDVHSATWAVHLSGRVREAARAQLRAVEVLAATPLTVTDLATGCWNLVSGAVQAAVVSDLLDEETLDALMGDLSGALGPEAPAGPLP